MKKLLIGLTLLASMSSFAISQGERDGEENMIFTGEGEGTSHIVFMAGCSDAKEEAISDARNSCHKAGYKICEELETKRTYRRSANPLRHAVLYVIPTGSNSTVGECSYESTFEGINVSQ